MDYEEWLEWREKYFDLEDKSSDTNNSLTTWRSKKDNNSSSLPTGINEENEH